MPHSAAAVVAPRPRWSPERKAIRAHKMILTALVVTIGEAGSGSPSGRRLPTCSAAHSTSMRHGSGIDDLPSEDGGHCGARQRRRGSRGSRAVARLHGGARVSYSQPAEAMNALAHDVHAGRLSVEDLRKKEIETAVVDTACYLSTGLIEVLAAACERAERAVLARAAGTGSSCAARSTTPWLGPRPCSTAMR